MKLKPGTRLALEIEPHGRKFKLTPRLRVASASRDMGPAKICDTIADCYVEIEKWAQEQLAREGLRATEAMPKTVIR